MNRGAKSYLFDSIWSDITDETTPYYYNKNWHLLSETDARATIQRWFVYGNCIDEPLMM